MLAPDKEEPLCGDDRWTQEHKTKHPDLLAPESLVRFLLVAMLASMNTVPDENSHAQARRIFFGGNLSISRLGHILGSGVKQKQSCPTCHDLHA